MSLIIALRNKLGCMYASKKDSCLTLQKFVRLTVEQISTALVHATYLCDLYLEGGLRVTEMCAVMFDGFITSIESILTLIAVPVSTLKLLHTFDGTDNVTVVTTT